MSSARPRPRPRPRSEIVESHASDRVKEADLTFPGAVFSFIDAWDETYSFVPDSFRPYPLKIWQNRLLTSYRALHARTTEVSEARDWVLTAGTFCSSSASHNYAYPFTFALALIQPGTNPLFLGMPGIQ